MVGADNQKQTLKGTKNAENVAAKFFCIHENETGESNSVDEKSQN